MSAAVISGIDLTPTHDGDTAAVVELRFTGGGTANVQIDGESMRHIMVKAGTDNAADLIGQSWSVLEYRAPHFSGAALAARG